VTLLRRADCSGPGLRRRRRRGRGFEYLDAAGRHVDDPEVLARVSERTIGGALADLGDVERGEPATIGAIEEAVLDLLDRDFDSPAIVSVARCAHVVSARWN
jgi:hypothetical protein